MSDGGPPTLREAWLVARGPWLAGLLISLLAPFVHQWLTAGAHGFVPTPDVLHDTWNVWDTQSYVHIAEQGYPVQTTDPIVHFDAFLPGYPMVIRAVEVLFRDTLFSAMLVSAVAAAVALTYMVRLVGAERDLRFAGFFAWSFALWPYAIFLTAAYTESLFLALVAVSLYEARWGSAGRACVFGALSVAVRVTGLVVTLPLALEVCRRAGLRPRDVLHPRRWLRWSLARGLSGVVLVPLPFLAFIAYMHAHTGDGLAFFTAQGSSSFNHHLALPWDGFRVTWGTLSPDSSISANFTWEREVFFGVLGLVVCAVCWWWPRFPKTWAAYCSAVWLSATAISFWLSVGRYELAMFPAWLLLAEIIAAHRGFRRVFLAVSGGLLGVAAVGFTTWQWVG